MKSLKFNFPIGYLKFNKNRLFNYQLNRWYSLGYIPYEKMAEVGRKITNFRSWHDEMLRQAEKSEREGNLIHAAFFYRAAEVFVSAENSEKDELYDKFIDLFYEAVRDEPIERIRVPYDNYYLPVIKIQPVGGEKRILSSFMAVLILLLKNFTPG